MKEFEIKKLIKIENDPLMSESDRGCVLILTSDLDNCLVSLLNRWFTDIGEISGKLNKRVFDFSGPLGTLSNKILIARSLGIISQELFHDLEVLRNIRNVAAHTNSKFSLSSKNIKDMMKTLNYNFEKYSKVTRYKATAPIKNPEESHEINENVMKGLGFIRFDKINYIFTLKRIILIIKTKDISYKNIIPEIKKILEHEKNHTKDFIEKIINF